MINQASISLFRLSGQHTESSAKYDWLCILFFTTKTRCRVKDCAKKVIFLLCHLCTVFIAKTVHKILYPKNIALKFRI